MPIITSLTSPEHLPQVPKYSGHPVGATKLRPGRLAVAQQVFLGYAPSKGAESFGRLSLTGDPVQGRAEPIAGRVIAAPICHVGYLLMNVLPGDGEEGPDNRLKIPVDLLQVGLAQPEKGEAPSLFSRFDFYYPAPELEEA